MLNLLVKSFTWNWAWDETRKYSCKKKLSMTTSLGRFALKFEFSHCCSFCNLLTYENTSISLCSKRERESLETARAGKIIQQSVNKRVVVVTFLSSTLLSVFVLPLIQFNLANFCWRNSFRWHSNFIFCAVFVIIWVIFGGESLQILINTFKIKLNFVTIFAEKPETFPRLTQWQINIADTTGDECGIAINSTSRPDNNNVRVVHQQQRGGK